MSDSVDRIAGLSGSLAVKAPVRVATTEEISLFGLQFIDGVSLKKGDRVLVKDQTNLVENGVYVVNTRTWSRAPDFNGDRDIVKGTLVLVVEGEENGDGVFAVTTDAPLAVPGVSPLEFRLHSSISLAQNLASVGQGRGASLVGIADAGGHFTGTTVEAALQELAQRSGGGEEEEEDLQALQALQAHLSNPTDAHDASAISWIPSGQISSAEDVQEALVDLYNEIHGLGSQVGLLETEVNNLRNQGGGGSRLVNIVRITTPGGGTYYKPANVTRLLIRAIGGGGGGGYGGIGDGNGVGGGGGGAGGYAEKFITSPASSYAYTVGIGGGGGSVDSDGSSGDSTIIAEITAGGGGGGSRSSGMISGLGGVGGAATGGSINVRGGGGVAGSAQGGAGGSGVFGGSGQGRGVGGGSDGRDNGVFGGGGGGGCHVNNGGRGGDGYIEIWEFA